MENVMLSGVTKSHHNKEELEKIRPMHETPPASNTPKPLTVQGNECPLPSTHDRHKVTPLARHLNVFKLASSLCLPHLTPPHPSESK
ncbi:hypothetical protein Pcinc_025948 [Petrolisthes cinctipes]|uniref:Uncharacterized protein n=1 Tax=Petrolisthes cinctipes TaxID=88211 RepID=A0AAE1F7H7_PETCI|nr:hypothetical protein Pcinc_025948 [Petrolisthes cinctipes]